MLGTPIRRNQRQGSVMVLLAILLPIVLSIAAFAINVVYMEAARTELQISTDVATRAAGRVLAVSGDQKQAIATAERLLAANPSKHHSMSIDSNDILFGVSTRTSENQRYQFGDGKKPNAVRLRSPGGQDVPMLFPTLGVPIEFRPIKTAISTQIELDISLVLDRSGSMAFSSNESSFDGMPAAAPPGWKFGDPVPPQARWLDTAKAVNEFLTIMKDSGHDERVTLNTYSTKSKTDIKLTDDYGSIINALNQHSVKFKGGATNIGSGILEGAAALSDKKFARPWASRVMIVMSDGIHNTGTDPVVAAKLAANNHIMIYTVTFSSEANQEQMSQVASTGLGTHYHAANGQQLADVFREIARSLPTLITF